MAVACHAALVGTSDAVEPLASPTSSPPASTLRISTAPARFDPAELAALNARLLHTLPYASVAERLAGSRWAAASRSGSPCAAISPC